MKVEECSVVDEYKRFDMFRRFMLSHAGILCCAGAQINIQTFHVEFFLSLVHLCRISPSPLQVIFYRNICTTIGFPVVLVFPTLMSAKPAETSSHGFLYGDYAFAIGHIQW